MKIIIQSIVSFIIAIPLLVIGIGCHNSFVDAFKRTKEGCPRTRKIAQKIILIWLTVTITAIFFGCYYIIWYIC